MFKKKENLDKFYFLNFLFLSTQEFIIRPFNYWIKLIWIKIFNLEEKDFRNIEGKNDHQTFYMISGILQKTIC